MNSDSYKTAARSYTPGIGEAVANRTINRKIGRMYEKAKVRTVSIPRRDDISLDHEVDEWCRSNGLIHSGYKVNFGDDLLVEVELTVVGETDVEKWEDVAERVADGNARLIIGRHGLKEYTDEFHKMHRHLRQASLLMSGRHLQHGDANQINRPMEVFTNCASSAASFLTFYLLLNGSGVGRAYDDAMMLVDWSYLPIVVPVIDMNHSDVQSGEINVMTRRDAEHLYEGRSIHVFEVPDSREGWAKAIEKMEIMAYQRVFRDDVLLLDFSGVRGKGQPIKGMQGRPASGPGPLMDAIANMSRMRDAGMAPWRAAMYADHYAAECVLVGGARRAARMSTKTWRDKSVLEFISLKRGGFLWSSNNSVTVDDEFWELVRMQNPPKDRFELWVHAQEVLGSVTQAAYHDMTGEPGLINQQALTQNNAGMEVHLDGNFAESARYKLDKETLQLTAALAKTVEGALFKMITNPCGEICLLMLGAYCVIADTVPYHAANDDDAEDAFRTATRALMRTNLMDSLYHKEVTRTNRIGVGITGLHEYAWKRFQIGFEDMIRPNFEKYRWMKGLLNKEPDYISADPQVRAAAFWAMLSRFKRAVVDEAESYAKKLGVVIPHTNTTIKPAGTTSKLFGLSEGAHLPSMREYLRWVQFRNDDPLVDVYREQGYPVRKLQTYSGTTIVGFPTQPEICKLGMGDKLVTAAEASPEDQYEYLRLLEKYWIRGVKEDTITPLEETGNQVSYTLKYNPDVVSFEEFERTFEAGQSSIRCCSVMPQNDASAYEYQPEEAVTKHQYELIRSAIKLVQSVIKSTYMQEDVGKEHVDCAGGACPVDFGTNSASEEKAA